MIYLAAIAEAGTLAAVVITFAGLLRAQQRAHARREDLLLNQLLHAVGNPWTRAPADTPQPDAAERPTPRSLVYAAVPEQEYTLE